MSKGDEEMKEQDADGQDALTEDFPVDAPPAQGLPVMTVIDVDEKERKATHKEGKGFEKALDILDEYEKGVPPRNPHVQNYEE